MTDAELVKKASQGLKASVPPVLVAEIALGLDALAKRLESGVIVPRDFLALARCPDANNSGHEQAWPCQWCHEHRAMLQAQEEPK